MCVCFINVFQLILFHDLHVKKGMNLFVCVCVCERVITCAQRAKKKVELDIALKWSDRREKGQRLERLLAGDEKHT